MIATVCLCCDQPQCRRFPSIPEGCLLTAWAESSAALGFLASQTLSVQTCAKWKQTQPRLLITIRLDLCPLFFSERHKMDDSSVRPLEKKKKKVGSWSCSLCPRDSPPRLDNTGWHTGTPRDFSNLLFHAQSYKLRDRHQSGIFCAMWRESSPNPVPLILLIAWAWPTLFIGVEPTVSQKANER